MERDGISVMSAVSVNSNREFESIELVETALCGISIVDTMHLKDTSSVRMAVEGMHASENQWGEPPKTQSSFDDAEDMKRMGKKQQLVRHFRLTSMVSFVAISIIAWEFGIFLISPALINGGRAGLIYNTIASAVGFLPVYLSMAEMASMAPTAGATYHWVSELAPESCQKILSYITGWVSALGWQAGNALGVFLVGTLVQTIITINDETYSHQAWQSTLMAISAIVIAYVGTVYGARILPYWQNAVFIVHIFAFFAFAIPPWISAPQSTNSQVWLEFQNSGGWSSLGLSIMIGQLTGIGSQVGVDAAAHMAEEVKDASYSVPRAMIAVYVFNSGLLLMAIFTICYHLPSVDDALADVTTYPAVYILRQSMSTFWITVLLAVVAFLTMASNIVYLTAVSRNLWAFARDDGLPCSSWISKIHPARRIPENACIITSVISTLIALIYLGSPVAFYAITSLFTVGFLGCYGISIACILWRRLVKPETLPPSKFSLGRYGVPINIFAVLYSSYSFFWSFWPQTYPITAAGFNWASPIFVVVLMLSGTYFVFRARHRYIGPVSIVNGRKIGFG